MTTPGQTNSSMLAGLFGDALVALEASDIDSSSTSVTINSVVLVVPPVSTPLASSTFSPPATPGACFSKLPVITRPVKLFCFPF